MLIIILEGDFMNYLNALAPYTLYKEICEGDYFVDKTIMIEEVLNELSAANKYICVTRPRRFGKTVMAHMLTAFLEKGVDSGSIFADLNIGKSSCYEKHLNKHDVIFIDFSNMPWNCDSYQTYINFVGKKISDDLEAEYPECGIIPEAGPWEALDRVFSRTGKQFVFIMDEWDSMFHNKLFSKDDQAKFLQFLRLLLKSKKYVELAYMTGILPIAKYSSGSELNMFVEYNMATSIKYSEYFGFTEEETAELYERYVALEKTPHFDFESLREWYNGYQTANGDRIFNPRAVICALSSNQIQSYWTGSGPYDEIFYYIKNNIAEVREDLVRMVAGEAISVRIQNYAAVSMDLETKDEIFSAMVVYGFLSYYDGRVSIPNRELMQKFEDVLTNKNMGYISKLALESDRMLAATLNGDTKEMERILSFAHDTEIPILNYNDEGDLAALVNLVYLSARNEYRIEREDRAGKGFADFLFYPLNPKKDCIILELKVDRNPDDAIGQIVDKKYALKFRGRLGDESAYTGRILAVGMTYNRDSKEHYCKVIAIR